MDTRRVLLYIALLILPVAIAATGLAFLTSGILGTNVSYDSQLSLALILGGVAMVLIAIATTAILIRNERKNHREMMSGLDKEDN